MTVKRVGTVENFTLIPVPSKDEIQAISEIKTILRHITKIFGPLNDGYSRTGMLKMLKNYREELKKQWSKISYYKKSERLIMALANFERNIILNYESCIPQVQRYYIELELTWDNSFDNPNEKLEQFQGIKPVKGIIQDFNQYWLYNGIVYDVKGNYSDEQSSLLIMDEFYKERRLFERLQMRFTDTDIESGEKARRKIPERVRIEVWRRDGGKCARCGSRLNLEYDHIIPVSKGGSNTVRNIELLCEKCNRFKGANIL